MNWQVWSDWLVIPSTVLHSVYWPSRECFIWSETWISWLGIWVLHYLPDFDWADGNLAEAAGQLGKIVEHQNQSQATLAAPSAWSDKTPDLYATTQHNKLSATHAEWQLECWQHSPPFSRGEVMDFEVERHRAILENGRFVHWSSVLP